MVKSIKSTSWFLFLSGLILVSGCRQPEPQKPDPVRRKSPIAIAKITHDPSETYVKIVYGQPYRRDRQVFGNIIPYGQVWRTGANEATELTTTKDIILGGKKLPAGTYTIFSIPRKDDDWTIILNGELGQWGAFEYDQSQDVLRVDVQARQKQPITEALNIQFSGIENNSTNIVLRWDQTVVRIPIEFIDSPSASS
jgi:hypothetical protein